MAEFRLQVRIPSELHEALTRSCLGDGISTSEFVRRAVADRIERRTISQLAGYVADKTAELVVRELEPLLQELATARREEADAKTSIPQAIPFERGCLDADLHRAGAVCRSCRGSF